MKKNGLAYIFFILVPLLFSLFNPAFSRKNAAAAPQKPLSEKQEPESRAQQQPPVAQPQQQEHAPSQETQMAGHESSMPAQESTQASSQPSPQASAQAPQMRQPMPPHMTGQMRQAYPQMHAPAGAYVAPNALLPGLCGYKCSSKNCPMDCNECCLRRQNEAGFQLTLCQENCARKAERQILFMTEPKCLRSCQMCSTGCERCCDLKFSPIGGKSKNQECKAACRVASIDTCLESCFDPECTKPCRPCCADRYREDGAKVLKCQQKCDVARRP